MANLTLNGINKIYPNGHHAVKGVNLQIDDGDMLVLVGPSGCGKSTLLRMIAGLERITDGDLLIDQQRVNDAEPGERDIAMVFQNYALYPHMTVFQNMAYGLKNHKVPKHEIQTKVAEVAKMLELGELLQRKPGQLSGGQRQRVAMGRAIVRHPKVFLFDEPLSNLDAKLRVQMRLEIKRLQRELATTAIYVTHDQVEAMTLADKLVVLNKGEVEQVGTPLEIYNQPASTFVASFMGSPAMNIIDAEVQGNTATLGSVTTIDLPSILTERQPVKVGIRPEHLVICENGTIKAELTAVEPLGSESILYARLNGTQQTVQIKLAGQSQLRVGEPLSLAVQARHTHLFDSQSGKRITADTELAAIA